MRARAKLALLLTLLVAGVRTDRQRGRIMVHKCCDSNFMLSGDGQSCVRADWSGTVYFDQLDFIIPPFDDKWVQNWLPPGLPLHSIGGVECYSKDSRSSIRNIVRVNSSYLWDLQQPLDEDVWKGQVVFSDSFFVVRPKPGGGFRRVQDYCVDAALPPLGPFVFLFETDCSLEECVRKCCDVRQVLVDRAGHWECAPDARGYWSPWNSSFLRDVDPEFPYRLKQYCSPLHHAPTGDRVPDWGRLPEHDRLFSTRVPCIDFYRDARDVREGLFYCEYPRVARGIYWLLRPLCVASALLLAAPLLSIACDKRRRHTVYGWLLGSHVACLFAFNVGQIVYYTTISDSVDMEYTIPSELQGMCRDFALSMYFLLIAAWFWLTALWGNIALDSILQTAPQSPRVWKRVMAFSTLAWGLPALLTVTCSLLFTPLSNGLFLNGTLPWYNPPLMKARVCYAEHIVAQAHSDFTDEIATPHSYFGTKLIYYGPVGCLVICNLICLVFAKKSGYFLRRSNTYACREGDPDALEMRGGNNLTAEHIVSSDLRKSGSRNGGGSRTDADVGTITLYTTVLLVIGGVELISEVINSLVLPKNLLLSSRLHDFDLPYRASGFATDFVRAACVAWFAAPVGGYVGPLLRWLRKKVGKFTRPTEAINTN